ncbi:DUF418 domain-containing protein [Larkinella soli]|uniref:DUF418 domain-containing protein n=1 Tax=Larkinella soli TaxID=1770527 RepID=UPI000FFB5821|nr:DUF418 domain-containing protein [Larkinella soli]
MNTLKTKAVFQPVRSHERIQLMDALRGFALFGILIVNSWSFSRYEWLPADGRADGLLTDGLTILIDTKFVTIFSILFGAGFAIQRQRALARGVGFGPFYVKRMALLFLIACLHAYLLWFGDIVRHYALLGPALLLVGHLSARATLRLSLLFILFLTPLVFILNGVLPLRTAPETIDEMPLPAFVFQSFTEGSYPRILRANWIIDPLHNFIQDMPITLVSMFGKMLLGVWLAKIGFFRNPADHQGRINRWLRAGGTLGLLSSVLYWAIKKGTLPMEEPWMAVVVFPVSGGLVLHSLFYLGLFVKLYHGPLGNRLLRFLAPVGRMGLTNYFGQTVLAFALFYGTGRIGRLMPEELLVWSLVIFFVQAIFSRWWLRRHEFGPVEWIWRRMAYLS